MDYELAKQLKDVEFPFEKNGHDWGMDECLVYGCDSTSRLHFPTLSELIEACGTKFRTLSQLSLEWVADAYDVEINKFDTKKGKTPEEAVAKLWLELNRV